MVHFVYFLIVVVIQAFSSLCVPTTWDEPELSTINY